jgi:hypothetical protein
LLALGFKNFDPYHLASAEAAGAEVFVTCDDGLLGRTARIIPANPRRDPPA